MLDPNGALTPEAIELINLAAREAPHEMYPLSRLAGDLGRARLLVVTQDDARPLPVGVSRGLAPQRQWKCYLTEEGWDHVTDPELRSIHRREKALKRLQDFQAGNASGDSRLGPAFNVGNLKPF